VLTQDGTGEPASPTEELEIDVQVDCF